MGIYWALCNYTCITVQSQAMLLRFKLTRELSYQYNKYGAYWLIDMMTRDKYDTCVTTGRVT